MLRSLNSDVSAQSWALISGIRMEKRCFDNWYVLYWYQLPHIPVVKAPCLLTPLVGKSDSHVRNSALFSAFISGQVLPSGIVLVSFDVISLFTNVPADLAVEVAHERLSRDTSLAECTLCQLTRWPTSFGSA